MIQLELNERRLIRKKGINKDELYNKLCPGIDSNIVEYAEDILYLINLLIDKK